ncbi:MAG: 50S ribosomal protein L18 [Candidatus Paceibacterota bacterium]
MNERTTKRGKRNIRHARVRAKISGTSECPRLSVFRSNKYMYAQLINDEEGKTIASASGKGGGSVAQAESVGKAIAEAAKKLGIGRVVFDRGGFSYTGTIKRVAENAREGGLQF